VYQKRFVYTRGTSGNRIFNDYSNCHEFREISGYHSSVGSSCKTNEEKTVLFRCLCVFHVYRNITNGFQYKENKKTIRNHIRTYISDFNNVFLY
jgi:hypothetical protein